jgi:hypothetical protein
MTAKTTIYEPPQDDLPYLVVTFDAGEMNVVVAKTRTEARKITSEKVIRRKSERKDEQPTLAPA